MKKLLFLIASMLLLTSCSSSNTETKEETKDSTPWVTFDTIDIEANEYGSFVLSGSAKTSFSITYNNHTTSIFVKDGKFKTIPLYDKNFPDSIPISFKVYGSDDYKPFTQTFTLNYSKYIARKEADEQHAQKIKENMPLLLEDIVTASNGQIIAIEPIWGNYTTLKVVLPLDLKYEKNGEKKRAMDSLGHDIQAKTSEILSAGKETIPSLTFRYSQTNELLGQSQALFKNRFTLIDKDTN
ncbi:MULTISPECIES: hypothetical protein [unclassified Enterococcus]|uniref:hypothetical protein n=1 Tax=unclassified Enterococcus TaxID=2608891 RepID=UPI001CE085C3|nr:MULTISPECIES: hypothetical protein [unclassified Enterococcus]MCA5013013.1 membrane lipoprotein lipid attachment site-containing protein [Enterococcus sp. S23]MCA5016264.1 membrane lipoprotein lipid attachment site-containing protein [Enterococcus sp. S22(2020)]